MTNLMKSSRDDDDMKNFYIAYNTRTKIVFLVSGRPSLYLYWSLRLLRYRFVSKSVYIQSPPPSPIRTNSQYGHFKRDMVLKLIIVNSKAFKFFMVCRKLVESQNSNFQINRKWRTWFSSTLKMALYIITYYSVG